MMAATNENAPGGGNAQGAGTFIKGQISGRMPSREPLATTHRAKLTATTEQHRRTYCAIHGRNPPCPRRGQSPTFAETDIMTKRPPFAAQQRNKIPTNGIWIYAGRDAWNRARGDLDKPSRIATLLPLGDGPDGYRWPVAGDEVVVVHTAAETAERLRSLAVELIRQGSTHVVVLDGDAKPEHYKPVAAEVAA